MSCAFQMDDALRSGISFGDKAMVFWRNYFVMFSQEENTWRGNGPGVGDTIEFVRDLQCDRARQQPQVPPPEFPQDQLAQRRWVMQNRARNRPVRRNVQRRGSAQTRPKD